MKKTLFALACGLTLAMNATPALALSATNADPRYLGSVTPGTPTSPADEINYINQLIGQAINTTVTNSIVSPPNPDTFVRSDNVCGVDLTCPLATSTGQLVDQAPANTVNTTGYTWLYLKYGVGDGAGAYVFNVAGLTSVNLLGDGLLNNNGGTGLSHWALFNPGTTQVPDGGATLGLLGLGMLGLGYLRRRRQ